VGSIHNEVTGFFYWLNPSSHTIALGFTHLLLQMSTGNFPGGKGHLASE
jgi:hypothetical protein